MTANVWSYEDLGPDEPQPIDQNPDIECQAEGCSTQYSWDRWQEIYEEITPETTLRCNECIGELIEQARIDRRKRENETLGEFA